MDYRTPFTDSPYDIRRNTLSHYQTREGSSKFSSAPLSIPPLKKLITIYTDSPCSASLSNRSRIMRQQWKKRKRNSSKPMASQCRKVSSKMISKSPCQNCKTDRATDKQLQSSSQPLHCSTSNMPTLGSKKATITPISSDSSP